MDNKTPQNNTCTDLAIHPKKAENDRLVFWHVTVFPFHSRMYKLLAEHINGPYEDTDFVGVSHRCGEFYGHIPFHYVRIGRNDPLLTAENIQIFYNENCYMIQAFGTYFETILINNDILTF